MGYPGPGGGIDPFPAAADQVGGLVILAPNGQGEDPVTPVRPGRAGHPVAVEVPAFARYRVALPHQMFHPGHRHIITHRRMGSDAGQGFAVMGQPGVRRVQAPGIRRGIRVSEQGRIVSELPRLQRPVGQAPGYGCAVRHAAVIEQVHPGMQGGAAGRTGGRLGEMVHEDSPLACQPVEGRRLHHRITQHGQAGTPPLIGGNEQDIHGRKEIRGFARRLAESPG